MSKPRRKSKTPAENRDLWATPYPYFLFANRLPGMSPHEVDAACSERNALAVPLWKIPMFKNQDSLSHPWPQHALGRIWCNPPYSDIDPWLEMAYAAYGTVTTFLIPSPNGERRYSELKRRALEIRIQPGRIAFLNLYGEPVGGNERGSSYFLVNHVAAGCVVDVERDAILEAFGHHQDPRTFARKPEAQPFPARAEGYGDIGDDDA